MGYNSVAVLYNDQTSDFENRGSVIGPRIADAMRGVSADPANHIAGHFGAGSVISVAHADARQVVVVTCNTGYRLEAMKPDRIVEMICKDYLERSGYRVQKKRARKAPTL